MEDDLLVEAPDLVAIGAQSLADNASRLGLTWRLRPATVLASTPNIVTAIYDGDTAPLSMTPLVGVIPNDTRVYGMTVPPAGEFVIGFVGEVPSPGERIATGIETADSANFDTTVTQIATVTAALVEGRIYRIRLVAKFASSAAGDTVVVHIREDAVGGSIIAHGLVETVSASAFGWPITLEDEYTATATGSKTFVGTAARNSGSGNIRREAGGNGPTYIYVDYIRPA